jgi:tRNA (guanine-N7-)-methyltransferase
MSASQDEPTRPVRSYVLRQGRISAAQQRAWRELLPRYGVAYSAQPLDLDALFGRHAPKFLEIGFGMGETLADMAAAHPDSDYIGIEVHTPGVGALLRAIDAFGIGNVRIIQHDAAEVLRDMIPRGSLAGIHIFFPDPWPKKRHHKRRLIQAAFADLLASCLCAGGYVHCATDWEDYAKQMLAVLGACTWLENTAAGFAPRPEGRPLTKFEARGLRLGHWVWDLVFRRRAP